jgi:hypothetical protein
MSLSTPRKFTTRSRSPAKPVGPEERGVPRERRAPVVSDDRGPVRAQRRSEADDVADEMEERIVLAAVRAVGLSVAAHVRRDGSIAGFHERLKLIAPGMPGLGKSVAEQHKRPFAGFGDGSGAVRLDRSMGDLDHVPPTPFAGKAAPRTPSGRVSA